MIGIEWFDEKIRNDYVGINNDINDYVPRIDSIVPKIEDDLKVEISNFPGDIAILFMENGTVSSKKIQSFLNLSFSQIEKEPALKAYIERCSLISKLLKNINKESYIKWFKKNSKKTISDYLDEQFDEYNKKYTAYPLSYPKNATSTKWDHNFKKSIVKTVLSEPYDKVFDYGKIGYKTRHILMDSLNIPVCPFCNRQYITSWEDMKKEKKSTADLDHFFPKSEYPLFALSLFNFVPSCQVCNSRMKLDHFMDDDGNRPIYPYEEKFDDSVLFKASISEPRKKAMELLEVWLGENTNALKIELDYRQNNNQKLCKYQKQVKRSIELYHLEEVYQAHKSYVSDLMLKKRIYDDGEYLKGLQSIFESFATETFDVDSDDMIYKLINSDICITHKQLEAFLYGFNWEKGQDKTRPLSKLAYDILKR